LSSPAPTTAASPSLPPAPTGGATDTRATGIADLGSLATRDELLHALATQLSATADASRGESATTSATSPDAEAIRTCDATLRSTDFEVDALTFAATVTYAGTPGFALLYSIDQQLHPAANGPGRVYVVDRSCAVLVVHTL
jgi:hypothetical protein